MNTVTIEAMALALDALTWSASSKEKAIKSLKIALAQEQKTQATNDKKNQDLLEACIEASSLFDNYPQCYEAIGTYEVLTDAIRNASAIREI